MNLAIGDEQTPGYNPKAIDDRYVSKPLTKALGEKTICKGMKGASITIKNKANLMHQLDQFSLRAYDRIFLFYGANDYFYSKANLVDIENQLTKDINKIKKTNPWLQIYGILPLPMYDKSGKALTKKRSLALYDLHDLIQMLSLTYSNSIIPSLNWITLSIPIINKNNYKNRLINGRYPTKDTYNLMSKRISNFVNTYENK